MESGSSPEAISDVTFREKLRGYHPDDVDAFVARVAAVVDGLRAELADTHAKLTAAEAHRQEAVDAEDSLRRTLVLAQRTADLAVKEAKEEAARLVAEAEAQRDALVSQAEADHAQRAIDSEAELRERLEQLVDARDHLEANVEALEQFLSAERDRLRRLLSAQLERLEGELVSSQRPGLYDIELPDEVIAANSVPQPAAIEIDVDALAAETAAATEEPDAEAAENDAFLAELRRAVDDDEPLGPRDDPLPEADQRDLDIFQEAEELGRFGNRLRRRR